MPQYLTERLPPVTDFEGTRLQEQVTKDRDILLAEQQRLRDLLGADIASSAAAVAASNQAARDRANNKDAFMRQELANEGAIEATKSSLTLQEQIRKATETAKELKLKEQAKKTLLGTGMQGFLNQKIQAPNGETYTLDTATEAERWFQDHNITLDPSELAQLRGMSWSGRTGVEVGKRGPTTTVATDKPIVTFDPQTGEQVSRIAGVPEVPTTRSYIDSFTGEIVTVDALTGNEINRTGGNSGAQIKLLTSQEKEARQFRLDAAKHDINIPDNLSFDGMRKEYLAQLDTKSSKEKADVVIDAIMKDKSVWGNNVWNNYKKNKQWYKDNGYNTDYIDASAKALLGLK